MDHKNEEGEKNSTTHDDIIEWHYFINNIFYRENGVDLPYTMNIDVKEKSDGGYFYSFALEKTKDARTADVLSAGGLASGDAGATPSSNDNIPQNDENNNSQYSLKNEEPNPQTSADLYENVKNAYSEITALENLYYSAANGLTNEELEDKGTVHSS